MKYRKHQAEVDNIADAIVRGESQVRTLVAAVTPGGGKSLLPNILAAKLIAAGLIDALCWVVPRRTLQFQGEANFQDPYFRSMIGHNLDIRVSTNDRNPCRGTNGFITTYQAIGIDSWQTVLADFSSKRYLLVLDEVQHAELNGVWHKALQPLADKAKYKLLMTGTASRGNKAPIAFMPYGDISESDTAIIRYGRKDALEEKAIIPLHFSFSDASAEWIDPEGQEVKCKSIADMRDLRDVSKAIYTAINTNFAKDLLLKGVSHWLEHKKRYPSSKLLVVTANVALAKEALTFLRRHCRVSMEIATSHESAAAQIAIKNLKSGVTDALVGVAMFYEGFDCKQVSHIIALTHVRSKEWLEQMFARSVRIDPDAGPYEGQYGYIFVPDDPLLRKVVAMIEAEQSPFVKKPMARNQGSLFEEKDGDGAGMRDGENVYGIVPLGSTMTSGREVLLGQRLGQPPEPVPTTPSEIEASLRDQIERHVRLFSFENRHNPKRLNSEIKQFFQKPRDLMSAAELTKTLEYVKKSYPLDGVPFFAPGDHARVRGCGTRVPTKATVWQPGV